ncbi:MAG TPA: hypothetical protein VK772_03835 [Puia sp.]|nr:hypothetical protein [Puia sp.]
MLRNLIMLLFATLLVAGCTKTGPTPTNNNGGNGSGGGNNNGGGGSGGNSSTLTFINDTYTPITVNADNQTQSIPVGSQIVLKGTPGASLSGTATTSGQTSSGTQAGLLITWNLSYTYPTSGNTSVKLNVESNYFFLKVVNQSALPMTTIYVNFGLTAQTTDNIDIPNDGKTYNIGYYSAYSNSNVKATNGNTYWLWSPITFAGLANQALTVTGN